MKKMIQIRIFQFNLESKTHEINRIAQSITSSISKNPYAEKLDSKIAIITNFANLKNIFRKTIGFSSFSIFLRKYASDSPLAKRNMGRIKSPKCTVPQTLWRSISGRLLLSLNVTVKKTIPMIANPLNASME